MVAALGVVLAGPPPATGRPTGGPSGYRPAELVTTGVAGGPADGPSVTNQDQATRVASAGGQIVVVQTEATDLVDVPDDNGTTDIVVIDRGTGRRELVSRSVTGPGAADGASRSPTISADGRWVGFASEATDLVADLRDRNRAPDVFLHDRRTGRTVVASGRGGGQRHTADLGSSYPTLSADGSTLAFRSAATDVTDLAPPRGATAVVVLDRATGRLRTITQSRHAPRAGNGDSDDLSLSDDGMRLAFRSESTDLVPGTDDNGRNDVFLWERTSGEVRLLSHRVGRRDAVAAGESQHPALSGDGATVAFQSEAPDLVDDDPDGRARDIFTVDVATGRIEVASLDPAGRPVLAALFPSLDRSGGRLAFSSDAGRRATTYLRDRRSATTVTVAAAADAALVAFPQFVAGGELVVVSDGLSMVEGAGRRRRTEVYVLVADPAYPSQRPAGPDTRPTMETGDPANAVPSPGPGTTGPTDPAGGPPGRWAIGVGLTAIALAVLVAVGGYWVAVRRAGRHAEADGVRRTTER